MYKVYNIFFLLILFSFNSFNDTQLTNEIKSESMSWQGEGLDISGPPDACMFDDVRWSAFWDNTNGNPDYIEWYLEDSFPIDYENEEPWITDNSPGFNPTPYVKVNFEHASSGGIYVLLVAYAFDGTAYTTNFLTSVPIICPE